MFSENFPTKFSYKYFVKGKGFFKSRLPFDFGLQILSQAIKRMTFSSFCCLQKKDQCMLSIDFPMQ